LLTVELRAQKLSAEEHGQPIAGTAQELAGVEQMMLVPLGAHVAVDGQQYFGFILQMVYPGLHGINVSGKKEKERLLCTGSGRLT
jgi:hypothetical protein